MVYEVAHNTAKLERHCVNARSSQTADIIRVHLRLTPQIA
jgi:hypothetical protein